MDKAEIKRQISYWETQLKEGERAVKVQQDQNATVKATIKSLKALLPKESLAPGAEDVLDEYSY